MGYRSFHQDSPPGAPEIERRLRMGRLQIIGLAVLCLLPLLALLGTFGETFANVSAASEDVAIEVWYATRFRFKMLNPLQVEVVNRSSQELNMAVRFHREYIDAFSSVTFTPSVDEVTEEAYVVRLPGVGPGEVRALNVSLQGERYWLHRGAVTVVAPEGASAAVQLETWVFP